MTRTIPAFRRGQPTMTERELNDGGMPGNNFMRSKYQLFQIIRIDKKTELVTVIEPHVLTTPARAEEICLRRDQKAGDDLVFHDYCREGIYEDGQQFNGNRR